MGKNSKKGEGCFFFYPSGINKLWCLPTKKKRCSIPAGQVELSEHRDDFTYSWHYSEFHGSRAVKLGVVPRIREVVSVFFYPSLIFPKSLHCAKNYRSHFDSDIVADKTWCTQQFLTLWFNPWSVMHEEISVSKTNLQKVLAWYRRVKGW